MHHCQNCISRLLRLSYLFQPSPLCFFFSGRRRHTRCYRDWSSDVCSSDLLAAGRRQDERACADRAGGPLAGIGEPREARDGTPLRQREAHLGGTGREAARPARGGDDPRRDRRPLAPPPKRRHGEQHRGDRDGEQGGSRCRTGGEIFQTRIVILRALMGYDAVFDKRKEECGVFGIWASEEAANYAYLGLHALQHRGQESAGIVSTDGETLHVHREMGLVADVFDASALARLKGYAAIGHVRYSTAGASQLKNAQPIAVQYAGGAVAVAHNGNLVNADQLRSELENQGSIFQASTDTEVIVHLIARARAPGASGSPEQLLGAIREALGKVAGAYSILFMTPKALVGA